MWGLRISAIKTDIDGLLIEKILNFTKTYNHLQNVQFFILQG